MNLYDAGDEILEKEARDFLADKLTSGDSVAGMNLGDLIDCALSGMGSYEIFFPMVLEILTSEYPETPLLQERFKKLLIEAHLDKNDYVVGETMRDIEQGRREEAAYENYCATQE
jgi:hypothetical protein